MKIDLHSHSTFSDGTDSVPRLLRRAQRAGLDAVAVTDHDTLASMAQVSAMGRRLGIKTLAGLEMSTHLVIDRRRRSLHLLAYGVRPDDSSLQQALTDQQLARRQRIPQLVERLQALEIDLTLDQVLSQASPGQTLGRPHVADAMVQLGLVANRDAAFTGWLRDGGPAWVDHPTLTTNDAIALVNRAGGVAVLAHPWGRGNEQWLTSGRLSDLASQAGLFGLEVDHVEHDARQRRRLRALAKQLGLVATGGSDYHGRGKSHNPLGAWTTRSSAWRAIHQAVRQRGGRL
ncbi:MAG: PHP domain-containing protein [Propionibacteriaceae bacterium]|jgi:predicted metal-dependent phosphoesterase TrpH|nr:PHP domain-containing protein [Propionibacteriaceae bacterium]